MLRKRYLIIISSVICLLLVGGAHSYAQEREWSDKEAKIKAAMFLNFLRFTTFPEKEDSISLCVLGTNPFGSYLELLSKKVLSGRKISTTIMESPSDSLKSCTAVFISIDYKNKLPAVLEITDTGPVLTVGEMPDFAKSGGIINFVIKNGKSHFEINLKKAKAQNLSLSARLLQLATIIEE